MDKSSEWERHRESCPQCRTARGSLTMCDYGVGLHMNGGLHTSTAGEGERGAGREGDWADEAARQIVGFVWGKFPDNRIPKWDSELAAIIRAAAPPAPPLSLALEAELAEIETRLRAVTKKTNGWITIGRITVDVEKETETFERLPPDYDQADADISRLLTLVRDGHLPEGKAAMDIGPAEPSVAVERCVECGHNNLINGVCAEPRSMKEHWFPCGHACTTFQLVDSPDLKTCPQVSI